MLGELPGEAGAALGRSLGIWDPLRAGRGLPSGKGLLQGSGRGQGCSKPHSACREPGEEKQNSSRETKQLSLLAVLKADIQIKPNKAKPQRQQGVR